MSTATMTNEERSAQEVADFMADVPADYFAYAPCTELRGVRISQLWPDVKITTWTGDELATVIHAGNPYRDNFGGRRQHFRAKAINGATYSGTAYLSAGDYVRMRKVGK